MLGDSILSWPCEEIHLQPFWRLGDYSRGSCLVWNGCKGVAWLWWSQEGSCCYCCCCLYWSGKEIFIYTEHNHLLCTHLIPLTNLKISIFHQQHYKWRMPTSRVVLVEWPTWVETQSKSTPCVRKPSSMTSHDCRLPTHGQVLFSCRLLYTSHKTMEALLICWMVPAKAHCPCR